MPTYKYRREDRTTFEIQQGINEEPLKRCPDTGQKVKRVITGGGGVVYKGDGWYVTDYKDNDRKEKAKAERKSNGEEGRSTENGTSDSEKAEDSAGSGDND